MKLAFVGNVSELTDNQIKEIINNNNVNGHCKLAIYSEYAEVTKK